MTSGPVVVKFGGSLFGAPQRNALLRAVARAGAVVVPGGGPFADAVRAAQATTGFSDRAAHAMAILAMDQSAHLLHDAEPSMPLCASQEDFEAARAQGRGAIWLPSAMALAARLRESWDVTSDSLAVWLAAELRAARLIVLKSAAVDPSEMIETLSVRGVMDPFAPKLARELGIAVETIGPATTSALETALASSARRAA